MIDWIISNLEKILERKGNRLIQKNLAYSENSKRLFVLIAPYRFDLKLFSKIERFVNSRGQSFIVYRFPMDMLTSDYRTTRDSFKKIQSDVSSDLADLKKKYGLNEIEIMGFSLGCVPALMIANGNPTINNIKLVVPGHCLAESLWFGIRTANLKREFERKGVTLNELKGYWKNLAPENNIDKLRGKNISIYLSKADTVIPFRFGMSLVKSLERRNLPFKLKINKHFGHYLTINNFLLRPSEFI